MNQGHSSSHSAPCISSTSSFLSDHQSSLNSFREALQLLITLCNPPVYLWRAQLQKTTPQREYPVCLKAVLQKSESFTPMITLFSQTSISKERNKVSSLFWCHIDLIVLLQVSTFLYTGSFLPTSSINLALPPTLRLSLCSLPESIFGESCFSKQQCLTG